jgi:glutamate synthase domain-containing protein 1
MPDSFYRRKVQETLGVTLGPQDSYGSGIVFTPKSDAGVNAIKEIFESQAQQRGMKVIGWRPIATGKSGPICILVTNDHQLIPLNFEIVTKFQITRKLENLRNQLNPAWSKFSSKTQRT